MAACRQLIQEVRSGSQADFTCFGERFEAEFTILTQQPGLDKLKPADLLLLRRRLRELERIRQQLIVELTESRSVLAAKLTGISKGQQGLDAYKATAQGLQIGSKRGEG
jgi:hypothetical protein